MLSLCIMIHCNDKCGTGSRGLLYMHYLHNCKLLVWDARKKVRLKDSAVCEVLCTAESVQPKREINPFIIMKNCL